MINLANDEDCTAFRIGQTVSVSARRRWWVRLWRWIARRKDATCEVVKLDYERGEITVSGNVWSQPSS